MGATDRMRSAAPASYRSFPVGSLAQEFDDPLHFRVYLIQWGGCRLSGETGFGIRKSMKMRQVDFPWNGGTSPGTEKPSHNRARDSSFNEL